MQFIAWVAATLVFASFFMSTMKPLRATAIASNIMFICYCLLGLYEGIFEKIFPIFILHTALLPLNIIRLQRALAHAGSGNGNGNGLRNQLDVNRSEEEKCCPNCALLFDQRQITVKSETEEYFAYSRGI